MEINIRRAYPDDTCRVCRFYADLIDKLPRCDYHPKWRKGVYPDDAYLEKAAEAGWVYLAETEGRIAGCMILNHNPGEGYEKGNWQVKAAPSEITYLHTLGVDADFTRRGIARRMVREAAAIAAAQGQKAIRLDVLCGNFPAEGLYRSLGFRCVGRVKLFYEVTGLCDFDLYEYGIGEKI